jgi:outer membrane protein OmpA-like peptidoglycan-associated protein
VLIVGHADLKGTEEYNDELSRRRALAIREALLAVGVPAVRIELAARGKREPLVPTPDGIPYVRNRRVEIRVR